MAQLRIVLKDRQLGPKILRQARANSKAVREAFRLTADQAAEEIEKEGRDDISAAGNFGFRWTDGWRARVGQGGGATRVTVTMAVTYWTVFQFGKVIHGKPLLWIPLSFASDAQGILARDFPQPLFRVDRKSGAAPLLMAEGGIPKYFGKPQVTIPKKFHLLEIIREVARSIPDKYRENRKG